MEEWYKVLIVDDEMLIRQGIKNYIDWEKEGFQIAGEASHGEEALQMIEALRPHIMITDIVMPVMSGEELVKKVKTNYPEVEIIVLSSFENFDYVRSTFQHGVADYILKPKLDGPELLKILRRLVSKMPAHSDLPEVRDESVRVQTAIQNILSGYPQADKEELLAGYFPKEQYSLLGLLWKDKKGSSSIEEKFSAELKRSFTDLVFQTIEVKETELTVLLNFNADELAAVKRQLKAVVQQSAETFAGVNVILSEPFNSVYDSKEVSEKSFAKLKQYTFYLPELPVLFYDELPPVNKVHHQFDLNYFLNVFRSRQFTAAFQYLEDHVDYLSGHYTNGVQEFKSSIGNILFNIIVLLENMKYDMKDLDSRKYSYFSAINDAATVNEAVAALEDFLAEVETVIAASSEGKEQPDFQRLLHYIEEHYSEPLNLTELAEHFHFNPSYLSTYFRRHHNEGFSEYLNQVRINKAKELLSNRAVSISEISGMVGYSDHSYFCKVFKKTTGMSPSGYRREVSLTK